jgi:putative hydrolases of HD superfamily
MNDLYSLIHVLKGMQRKGWVDRGLNADSIAEHAFGAMVIGLYLAQQEKVDSHKVVEMLLMHDLVMAEMEDVTPSSGKYQDKRTLEEQAKQRVVDKLPEGIREEYLSLFDEFNAQETPEAHVAKDADKLETLYQGLSYEQETGRTDILDEFLITYSDIFKTETGKKMFEEIKQKHGQTTS